MKTNFNKKITTAILAGLIAVSFIPATAGACRRRGQGGRDGGMGCDMMRGQNRSPFSIWQNQQMVQDLSLTAEQIKKLQEADFASREQHLTLKAEMDRLRLKMDQAFSADVVDDKAVLQLSEEMAAAKGKMFVQRTEARLAMKKLLTAEQINKTKLMCQKNRPCDMNGQGGRNGMNRPCDMNNGSGRGQGQNKNRSQN